VEALKDSVWELVVVLTVMVRRPISFCVQELNAE
jgi:hypothetical protein